MVNFRYVLSLRKEHLKPILSETKSIHPGYGLGRNLNLKYGPLRCIAIFVNIEVIHSKCTRDAALLFVGPTPSGQDWIRMVDVVLALAALVFLAPLMLLVALAIRITSPGPVIYVQRRIGKMAKPSAA
jgi:hypothetical protein